jgi:hypothetical protein
MEEEGDKEDPRSYSFLYKGMYDGHGNLNEDYEDNEFYRHLLIWEAAQFRNIMGYEYVDDGLIEPPIEQDTCQSSR